MWLLIGNNVDLDLHEVGYQQLQTYLISMEMEGMWITDVQEAFFIYIWIWFIYMEWSLQATFNPLIKDFV